MAKTAKDLELPRKEKKMTLLWWMGGSLAINALAWFLLWWKIPFTTSPVYLHYNIYFGIDLTGSWWQLFWLPASGLVIIIINGLMIFKLKKIPKVMQIIIMVATLVMQVMTLLSAVLVVLLNI